MSSKSNLLLITHTVDYDHSRARFMCSWLEEFSKYHERVHVIALFKGDTRGLPNNVIVHGLGKEHGKNRLLQVFHFWQLISRLNKEYGVVFVHNYGTWVTFGFPVFKWFKKPVLFWQCNKKKGIEKYFGGLLCDLLLTHSKKSFPYSFPKKTRFLPHGVDVELFHPRAERKPETFTLLTVGRVSEEKRLPMLLSALARVPDVRLIVAGTLPGNQNALLLKQVVAYAERCGVADRIEYVFNIPNKCMNGLYNGAHASVNLSETGALDKVVFESMAAGTPAIICNKSFEKYFGSDWKSLYFDEVREDALVEAIERIKKQSSKERRALGARLRKQVVQKSSVPLLIKQFEGIFEELQEEDSKA